MHPPWLLIIFGVFRYRFIFCSRRYAPVLEYSDGFFIETCLSRHLVFAWVVLSYISLNIGLGSRAYLVKRLWKEYDHGWCDKLCWYTVTVFTGSIKVISVKLSKSGSPLVVLATRHAFLFDTSLMCWLRVADDCFPASNFSSSWNLGSAPCGELAGLQVDVRKYMARKPGWNRLILSSFP